jgi:hypothetical protein
VGKVPSERLVEVRFGTPGMDAQVELAVETWIMVFRPMFT